MKKIKKISIILCLILVVGLFIILLKNNKDEKIEQTKNQNKSGLLSFMVEKGDGTYEEKQATNWPTADNYIFNETLSKCERGSKLKYDSETQKVQVIASGSDRCYVYFDYAKLTDYILKGYTKDGDNNIYYHDGSGSYTNSNLEADDLSYRYSGSFDEVNNYVCFGTDASSCPADNLYRIIGFFKNDDGKYEIKIIKADYANKNLLGSGTTTPSDTPNYSINGSFYDSVYNKTSGSDESKDAFAHRYRGSLIEANRYSYQENGTNDTIANWPTSLLNTIHLNHNFLNTFSKFWQDKIVEHKWHYIGSTFSNIAIASKSSNNTIRTTFDYEIGKNADKTLTDPTKIGLMYVNDYLYAASPNNWSLKPYNNEYEYKSSDPDSEGNPQGTYKGDDGTDYRSAVNENWMYMGLWEWTITQRTDSSGVRAFNLYVPGIVSNYYVGKTWFSVRPTFYLRENTKITDGVGTKDNPYRLI